MWSVFLLIILSSLFSKHVNLYTKNNTIVHIATRTPAMGVRDHVFCEHFRNIRVIWCIGAFFKDICHNPFSFMFTDKY